MVNQHLCRQLLRRRLPAAMIAGSALALAGCGGAQGLSATGSVSVTPGSGSGSTAAPPATSSSTPVALTGSSPSGRCRVGQLAVRQVSQHGAAGSIHLVFALRNRSARACSLYGYPGLGLLDASGSPLPTTVLRTTSPVVPPVPERRVRLEPGRRVWFYAGYSDVSSTSCPTAAQLEVTPPNDYGHRTIPTSIAPCGGVLNVSPVFAGEPIF